MIEQNDNKNKAGSLFYPIEKSTESGEEFNLSIVENHYSAPSAPPIQIDQLMLSASSLPTSDGAYSSSPVQIPVSTPGYNPRPGCSKDGLN